STGPGQQETSGGQSAPQPSAVRGLRRTWKSLVLNLDFPTAVNGALRMIRRREFIEARRSGRHRSPTTRPGGFRLCVTSVTYPPGGRWQSLLTNRGERDD